MITGSSAKFRGKYDFCTFYLIPGLTILLASRGSWSDTNLSVLGSMLENKLFMAVWGLAVGSYCCAYMLYLFRIGRYRGDSARALMGFSAVFFFLSFIVPYMPKEYPLEAALHVFFAFFSTILFVAGLICFLRFVSRKDRAKFLRAWYVLWLLAGCALVFLALAGFITSFLEVFIVLSICGYLRYMERLLQPGRRRREPEPAQ